MTANWEQVLNKSEVQCAPERLSNQFLFYAINGGNNVSSKIGWCCTAHQEGLVPGLSQILGPSPHDAI